MKKLLIPAAVAVMVSGSAMAETSVKSYGFIKAAYLMSKDVDSSFKPFSADETNANTELDGKSLSQLSLRDSRFGIKANNGSKASATLEFDFNGNAANSAGAAGGTLRHRQAFLSYKTGNGEFKMGKMWTQFAGLNPHTYAVTTVNLKAGNTGFLADAVAYKHNIGDKMVLGFETTTNGNADEEVVSGPNMGLRFDYKLGKGLAGFAYKGGTTANSDAVTTDEDVAYSAMKVFYHGNYGATDVKFEYYTAKNGGGVIGTIGGTADAKGNGDDSEETGYWLSVKHSFGDSAVFGGMSMAEVTNADDITGESYEKNAISRIGFDHKLDAGVVAFIDHSMFATTLKNDGDTQAGTQTQIGMMYKF